MKITGAELFVKALKKEHVDTLFAYPGGQAIDLFDALYGEKDIEVILPRHEQGLVHAADGYARSTGKVGVCLVTSGPGATNLVTGIATANYDSVPLVCFTGQVSTNLIGNDAFQEVDIVGITRNICKYAVTVRKREDLAETIKKDHQMFGDLEKYKSKDFYNSHRYIQFDTLSNQGTYEIIAVFKTTANGFDYQNYTDFTNEEQFNTFMDKCKSLSLYETETNSVYGDRLITLSTC